jgi:hypothetical protein
MAKLLARSKSLRQLRPSRKDSKEPAVPEYVDTFESHLAELEGKRSARNLDNGRNVSKLPSSLTRGGLAIDSADTIARPKTANEAMDRKRELMATGSPISVTSGQDTFNFPTPLRRPFTPNSVNPKISDMRLESPQIGIALGSPSHTAHFQPGSMNMSPVPGRHLAPGRDNFTPLSTPGQSQTSWSSRFTEFKPVEPAKPKLSRWKSLGGLFARRPSTPKTSPRPEYQSLSQGRSPNFDLKYDGYASPWQGEGPSHVVYHGSPANTNQARFGIDSPKKSKSGGRFGLGRSQTAPSNRSGGRSPIPPPKDPPGPVLDVEIPTTQMERYSVMFNGVLPKRSTPSLLERRKANGIERKPLPVTSSLVNGTL